ncbi:hypothetical protein MYCTH_2123212 [Thermothelomyces thermophilus ATCC 42464]|uniref:Uncharacterized protein n=1 Tax=Thermothelomyces thermophilus (strain ATCC 42464 / BCRC 31852 / DSM 1799) TaxID=573729 RepID=G2Q2W6_THET4|nr:uncharacterized protein MYCTH_2123212 [Thermothelomyces thermophilus ATCC 42464]AEO54333.1 hypothetical protein MYCTH_2123212 [Thermothelomyces thermophilus ATCC 42464]
MNGTTVKANDKKKRAKKGHYKRECRSPKKEWKPVPGKEIADIDETTKNVTEVAATSYEDKDSDIDSLGHDGDGANRRAPGPTELQRVYGDEGPSATQDARDGRNFWFQLLRQASTTTVGISCRF